MERKLFCRITRVSFVCICIHSGCELGTVTLLYCGISGCCTGITLAVYKLNTLLYLSLLPVPSSQLFSLSLWSIQPLSFDFSDIWKTQERPVRLPPVYSSTGKHDDIMSTQGQRGGMMDTKSQWEKGIRRHVWRGDTSSSDMLPIMRHCLNTNVERVVVNQPFIWW